MFLDIVFLTDYQVKVTEMSYEQKEKVTVRQMDLLDDKIKKIKGKGTSIAILDMVGTKGDKGFHTLHRAFKDNIYSKDVSCVGCSSADKDATNHATVCAGIAVGKPFDGYFIRNGKTVPMKYEGGVAPEAKAKIFLMHNIDSFLQVLSKIGEEEFDVVSISLGCKTNGLPNVLTQQFVQLSKSKLVVVSAGNYGPVKGVLFPANLDEVISVGCLDEFGDPVNYAPKCVDISCYGEVNAPASDGMNGLLQWATGTSMAAPAIAGLICLFIQCAKEGTYLSEEDKADVLYRIKQKKNMVCILDKTTQNKEKQVKPAALLEEASKAENFKKWFDDILKGKNFTLNIW